MNASISALVAKIHHLRVNREDTDVTLKCQGTVIEVHSFILGMRWTLELFINNDTAQVPVLQDCPEHSCGREKERFWCEWVLLSCALHCNWLYVWGWHPSWHKFGGCKKYSDIFWLLSDGGSQGYCFWPDWEPTGHKQHPGNLWAGWQVYVRQAEGAVLRLHPQQHWQAGPPRLHRGGLFPSPHNVESKIFREAEKVFGPHQPAPEYQSDSNFQEEE